MMETMKKGKKMKGKLGSANGMAKKGSVNRGTSKLTGKSKIMPMMNSRDMMHEEMVKKMVGRVMGADHNGM